MKTKQHKYLPTTHTRLTVGLSNTPCLYSLEDKACKAYYASRSLRVQLLLQDHHNLCFFQLQHHGLVREKNSVCPRDYVEGQTLHTIEQHYRITSPTSCTRKMIQNDPFFSNRKQYFVIHDDKVQIKNDHVNFRLCNAMLLLIYLKQFREWICRTMLFDCALDTKDFSLILHLLMRQRYQYTQL